jgi:hypothetical protein
MLLRHAIHCLVLLLMILAGTDLAFGNEPNEIFSESTVLAPGVLSINDALTALPAEFPDTVLVTLNAFDQMQFFDDDDSIYGNGRASGLSGIEINPGGTINFLVSGYDDFEFVGSHEISGPFEVIVDVYDFLGDFVEQIRETRTLAPAAVEEFFFQGDASWNSGMYDVNIDNAVSLAEPSDIDFFTFTGLEPGESFLAEISQDVFTDLDTVLGWFDEAGVLLEVDDDDGFEHLSVIEGIVPANGTLTFAVSGFADYEFEGIHSQNGDYKLQVTINSETSSGDFDNDGDVDGRDFLLWQRNQSVGNLSDWQANYGFEPGMLTSTSTAVPEPGSISLALVALSGFLRTKR